VTDTAIDTVNEPETGVTPRTSSRRPPVRLLVLGALVAVSAVVVALLGWQSLSDRRAQDARDQALAAARTDSEVVLSYTPRTLDSDLARSRQLISGEFSAKFDQLASSVVEPATKQVGLATTAKVVRAAVIDANPEQMHALLYISQTSTSTSQPQPKTTANQVKVTMTKARGQWLISEMQPL
jgi:Mce-associated membrane protein